MAIVDFEAVLPFPILALLLWPANLVRTAQAFSVVFISIVILGQFMILTRAFTQSHSKTKYFFANELLLTISVGLILGAQYALANT
jgi:hypothetical protein